MVFPLVPNKVFITPDCDEAQRPRCPERGTPHVHIGCGGTNNWAMGSIAMLKRVLLVLEAGGHLIASEREVATQTVEEREGPGLREMPVDLTDGDLRRLDLAFFISEDEDPLAPAYREHAPMVIQSAFFPG